MIVGTDRCGSVTLFDAKAEMLLRERTLANFGQAVRSVDMRQVDVEITRLRGTVEDPAVAYLNHEDTSSIIAPSFTSFLKEWESVCYVGPEIWMLEPFLNEKGQMDGSISAAKEMRAMIEEFLTRK